MANSASPFSQQRP